jgi:hypothetical protein
VELNRYFREQIYPNLPPDIQQELTGVELSSNLLALIDSLQKKDSSGKTYYQRYQEETGEGGKTKWEELQIKIHVGKGRYEAARGDQKITDLQRKFIDRMMERNYEKETGFRFSDLPRGVELAKDALLYGGSFLSGGLLGLATRVGGRMFIFGLQLNPLTATLSTSLVAASREGVVFAHHGRLKGIAGKAWQDFVQVSREAAQGRKGIEGANLRKQFEALLVSSESAENLTQAITNLLQKDNLTEDEQKQLLLAIAHAQARLKMTDLSVRRGKRILGIGDIEVPQNFITYHSDKRNEELTALHSAILEGMAKLTGVNSDLAQKLEEVTSIYMAQLRVGSTREKLAQAITLNNPNISSFDAQRLVKKVFNEFGEKVNLNIAEEKSLEGSVARLATLTWKRAGQTFVMSAVFGGIAKVTLTPIVGEVANLYHDVARNVANLNTGLIRAIFSGDFSRAVGKGFSEWLSDWQKVVSGDVPIEMVGGRPVVDLSPLQGGYLSAKYYWHDFMGLFNHHLAPITETFNLSDGSHLELTNGIHIQQGDFNSDGHLDTIIIDKHHPTEILGWFNGQHLEVTDYNSDGTAELVFVDANGEKQLASDVFRQYGINNININIVSSEPSTTQTTEIFSSTGTYESSVVINGHHFEIPQGTHLEQQSDGSYQLVPDNNPHHLVLATIDKDGNITYNHSNILVDHLQSTSQVENPWQYASDYRVVHAHTNPQAIQNYVESTGDPNHPFAVRFVWHDKIIHNPNTGADIDVASAYRQGQVGMFLQIPHYGPNGEDVGIFVPAQQAPDGGWQVVFDPTDTHTIINVGGHQITMADLSKYFLNQEHLRQFVSQHGVGELGSEMTYEGRGAFNLANPDGLIEHQGRILAGVLDPTSNPYGHNGYEGAFLATHAVHGSGRVLENINADISFTRIKLTLFSPITQSVTVPGKVVIQISASDRHLRDLPSSFSPWFTPVRENIERSTKGEEGKVTPPSAQPTSPSSQPPPPSSSAAFTPEDKQALEQKKAELENKRNRILEAIESARKNAPDKKPTEEQEKELATIDQELAEIEARLKASETKKPKIEIKKEEFEKEMQQIVDLLETKSLDEINQILDEINQISVSLRVEKLKDQTELDNLRKDETQLRRKALDIVLARINGNVINAIIKGNQEEFEQIWREEESKLSQSDRQKLAHYQELKQREDEISVQIKQLEDEEQKNKLNQELTQVKQEAQKLFSEIQPLVLDIYKKAKKRFYEKHKGEIDSEFERIKKQINEWEKEGTKVGSK